MVSYFSSVMATQRHTDIEILNPGHTKRSAACTTFLNVGGHQKAIVGLDEQQIHEFYRHMIITLFSFPRKRCLQGITFLNVSRLDLQFYFSYPTGSPIPTKVGLWNSLAYQAICPPHWSWTGCQDTLNGSTYWAKESGLVLSSSVLALTHLYDNMFTKTRVVITIIIALCTVYSVLMYHGETMHHKPCCKNIVSYGTSVLIYKRYAVLNGRMVDGDLVISVTE